MSNKIWHLVYSYYDKDTLCGVNEADDDFWGVSSVNSISSRWHIKEFREQVEWCDACVLIHFSRTGHE